MRVLLDTNAMLMAIPSKSAFHPIFKAFNERKYFLVVTGEIFLEYEAILIEKANSLVAFTTLSSIIEAPNVISATIYFRWNLITVDPDDNKFTDAYLASQADCLVTTDSHFESIKKADYPKINVVSPNEFLAIVKTL